MDLRKLKYFMHVVDAGSISRAADVVHIVQPSLSLQIKSLEDELGVQLLVRHVRGVTPTDQGRMLYDYARRILEELERAKDALKSSASSPRGQVTIGLPTTACRGLAVHLVLAARKRFPGLSVRIVEAMTGILASAMDAGKLDIAMLYDHKAFENVAWTEMMTEELLLIAANCAPIARSDEVEFKELASLPLVLPDRTNVLRYNLERIAIREDLALNTIIDCDSLPTIIQLVQNGYHSVLPHFAVSPEINRAELKAIPLVNPTPFWRLSVVLSKRTLNMPGAQALAELMAETIQDLVRQGMWRAQMREARA